MDEALPEVHAMGSDLKTLKVSIFTSPSAWGGAEVHTAELARTLEARGHDVVIVEVGSNFYGQGRFDQNLKIGIFSMLAARSLQDAGILKSLRILRKLKGDVCIVPKSWFYSGNWVLDLAARIVYSRYITIEHLASHSLPPKSSKKHLGGLIPGAGIWWYKAKLVDFLRSKLTNRVVCVSDAVGKKLVEFHRYPPSKVTTIHNGINTDIFIPLPEYRGVIRKKWSIPEDALVFGSMGRFDQQKGFDVAIELFNELIVKNPDRDLRLVLVGKGDMYNKIRHSIDIAGLEDKIILADFTDRPWEVYSAIDVFIMPSKNEGLPFALIEAMACGCAPIAMGVGGIPEVITRQGLGWLVPPGNNPDFLAAMNEAANSGPVRLEEIGREAREHIVSFFNAEKQYSKLADLIEKENLVGIQ